MLMRWFWNTAGDKNEGYLGGSVKIQGEDRGKAGTCDDIIQLKSNSREGLLWKAEGSLPLGRGPQLELLNPMHDL